MTGLNKGGYWPSWSEHDFPPANIQTTFLTHVYYAFLNPNQHTFQFEIDDTTASALRRFTTTLHQKSPPIKTLFSVGGSSVDQELFSRMASSQGTRDRFIHSTIQVARRFHFDGVDLDWEFPKTQDDMDSFGLLLAEWRVAVNQEAESTNNPKLLLSAATYYKPVIHWDVVHTYPVESMNNNLDWINAMCYDYHGSWDEPPATGTLAALYDPNGNISTSVGLLSWINAGIQRRKLVMGLPLFGRSWKLHDPTVHGIGAKALGIGPGEDGYMIYAEVEAFNVQNNARVVFDEPSVSVYSVAGTTWIGYDDVRSIKRKIEYAKALEIGGYFFWEISGDQGHRFSGLGTFFLVIFQH
ncbi:hypothetical protein L1987_29870 [Smallanthus sonchifolius]|uniref:Uncharacterized protein n=1 Tax=Smallanthus sonchifolius TaxID=185202 RepID=A0ACB9I1X8_9ASTR|nr:hypothetical protein L1987_29870 [Smallanthus sonchifolius]